MAEKLHATVGAPLARDIKFYSNTTPASDRVQLYIVQWMTRNEAPWKRVVTNLMLEPVAENEPCPASMDLTYAEAQDLIDALYQAGVRPTAQRETSEELKAVQLHLADMRRIAFEALEK